MKKLTKAALALACVAFLSLSARAENYFIPQDNNGNIPGDINLIGADVFTASGTAVFGSTRPVILYGYSISSDTWNNFAVLRDTNFPNTSSAVKLALYRDAQCLDTMSNSSSFTTVTCNTRLPVPVLFRNGIAIELRNNVNGVTGGAGAKGRWMFYFRYTDIGGTQGKKPTDVDPAFTDKQGAF